MKELLKTFRVEIERLGWLITLGLITLIGAIAVLTKTLSFDAYFMGQCFVAGLGYIASVLKKSKKEIINNKMKQLLAETKDSGAHIGVMENLDDLTALMQEAGPLFDQINTITRSKQLKTRIKPNNDKQILN